MVDLDDLAIVVGRTLHLEDGSVGGSRDAAVVAGTSDLARSGTCNACYLTRYEGSGCSRKSGGDEFHIHADELCEPRSEECLRRAGAWGETKRIM